MSRGNDVATTSSMTFSDRVDLGVNRSGHVEVESRKLWQYSRVAQWHLHLRLQGISLASASSAGYSEGLCLRFGIFSGSHYACRVYPHCNSTTRDKFSDLSISITCRSVTLQDLKRR